MKDERQSSEAARKAGEALAFAAYERGERLREAERTALMWNRRYGSDSWPVHKVGRKWSLNHDLAKGFGLFATRTKAEIAWQTLIAKWIRMAGLEAGDAALADRAARNNSHGDCA